MKNKTLCAIFAYNEGDLIFKTINDHPFIRDYDLLVYDDGSTDALKSLISVNKQLIILRNKTNKGIGCCMKKVFQYAIDNKYNTLVIEAGNFKDRAKDLPKLITPILTNKADIVQGSRFLHGAVYSGMPLYRIIATKYIHPFFTSLASGKKVTESTNGYRAYRVDILKDIDWKQSWIKNTYDLEPYMLVKSIRNGWRHLEVPVDKIYAFKKSTKMSGIKDFWSILRPVIYLWLGIKK
jgi:dolichol-phosphate mannosyltransferase